MFQIQEKIIQKVIIFSEWVVEVINDWKEWFEQRKNGKKDEIIVFDDDDDFYSLDFFQKGCDKFLNIYETKELEQDILNYRVKLGRNMGKTIKQILQKKGFENLVFTFDLSDYYVHKVCFY